MIANCYHNYYHKYTSAMRNGGKAKNMHTNNKNVVSFAFLVRNWQNIHWRLELTQSGWNYSCVSRNLINTTNQRWKLSNLCLLYNVMKIQLICENLHLCCRSSKTYSGWKFQSYGAYITLTKYLQQRRKMLQIKATYPNVSQNVSQRICSFGTTM